jgi:hypothetical protein
MKRIILIAALVTVSACSKPAPAPTPSQTTTEASSTVPAQTLAADGKPSVGTYKVTTSDGKIVTEVASADGTYVDTIDGKVVETGKWEQKSPEQYCYTKDEPGAKQKCNVERVDEKGVWTTKDPEGKIATVERVKG